VPEVDVIRYLWDSFFLLLVESYVSF